MTQSDFDDFAFTLANFAELYGKPLSSVVIQIWWAAMQGTTLKDFKSALAAHAINPDNGQFMPKPADVVRLISGKTNEVAMMAWSKVEKAVRSIGTYQSVVFDDPIIHAVISEMGGWVKIGSHNDEGWPFVSNEFQARYRAYQTTKQALQYPPILSGVARLQNHSSGYRDDEVRLIGDPIKAKTVMSQCAENESLKITHSYDIKRLQ